MLLRDTRTKGSNAKLTKAIIDGAIGSIPLYSDKDRKKIQTLCDLVLEKFHNQLDIKEGDEINQIDDIEECDQKLKEQKDLLKNLGGGFQKILTVINIDEFKKQIEEQISKSNVFDSTELKSIKEFVAECIKYQTLLQYKNYLETQEDIEENDKKNDNNIKLDQPDKHIDSEIDELEKQTDYYVKNIQSNAKQIYGSIIASIAVFATLLPTLLFLTTFSVPIVFLIASSSALLTLGIGQSITHFMKKEDDIYHKFTGNNYEIDDKKFTTLDKVKHSDMQHNIQYNRSNITNLDNIRNNTVQKFTIDK